jgi:VanZ family protein
MPTINRTDYLLWASILIYTGVIYSTLSLVSHLRKWMTERWGPGVFDSIYVVFALLGVFLLVWILRYKPKGERLRAIAILAAVSVLYAYYLSRLHYAAERLHFLQYGAMGVLLLAAFARHCTLWTSVLSACMISYWIGLGDEAIQWALPNRVGEIGDSIVNLFSAILGAGAFSLILLRSRFTIPVRREQAMLSIFGMATGIFTALFLTTVHGFGTAIESTDTGRFFSHFTARELARINQDDEALSPRAHRIYRDEAQRHLHQREFYFVNRYKGRKGNYYRRLDMSAFENRILEKYYARYLRENMMKPARHILERIDTETAQQSASRTVQWPDSLSRQVARHIEGSTTLRESRVKSTIITAFTPGDLLFYLFLWLIVMGSWLYHTLRGKGVRNRAA